MRYRILPAAQVDVDDIAEYLAADNLDTGYRFLAQVDQTIKQISTMPGIAAVREFANNRISGLRARRVTGFPNWLIFYLVREDAAEIIRVLHGARDLDRIFDDEPV